LSVVINFRIDALQFLLCGKNTDPINIYSQHFGKSDSVKNTCFSLGRDAMYTVQQWSPVEEVWGKCSRDTNTGTPNRSIWSAWVLYFATVI